MRKNITVFCGSADDCPEAYLDAAEELGRLIAKQGRTLVYGSGMVGLMGRVAKGAIEEGGFVVGINVECYRDFPPYPGTGELLMAKTISDVIQAGLLDRPIGLLNVNHYYDGLLMQLERAYQDKLLKEKDYRRLISAPDSETLLRLMDEQ